MGKYTGRGIGNMQEKEVYRKCNGEICRKRKGCRSFWQELVYQSLVACTCAI
uniref:Uncharacterized protein n=1 Tax=Anguilla anguilla TaxID=7936 RepID=A0A0E9PN80_ANGAN